MAKTAWLIISDLHLYYKNFKTRVDYVGEMKEVRENIARIAQGYKEKGFEKVNLLLLGDVFHRSYQNVFNANYDNNFFVLWKQLFGDVYSVVGNHELHFYEANPFFTLVREIKSKKLQLYCNDVWTPRGLLPTINVVDRIEDGEVVFHFNHFSTPISAPEDGKINIGLFHQDISSPEIVEAAKMGISSFAASRGKGLELLEGYQYCFFGHLHTFYGVFKADETYLYYLASLGRTSTSEIDDNFLERCIPAVLTEDGKLLEIEENKIQLWDRASCVKQEVVEKNKNAYEIQKLRKAAKEYVAANDDPIENLKSYFAEDQLALDVIDNYSKGDIDPLGAALTQQFTRIIGG